MVDRVRNVEERGLTVRSARPGDYDAIVAVVDDWWGRPVSKGLTRLFLDHFFGTSLIAEHGAELAGFLIGFLSPSKPRDAYVHFAAVAPAWRRTGLARSLYEQFFERARHDGRTVVAAITSPQNGPSIAFHRAMGFAVSGPIRDYDGPSVDRVVFSRELQRLRPSAHHRADLPVSPAAGSGRHSSTRTIPGSTWSMPAKNRAICSRVRPMYCCCAVRLTMSSKPRFASAPRRSDPRWDTAR